MEKGKTIIVRPMTRIENILAQRDFTVYNFIICLDIGLDKQNLSV